MVTMGGVGRSVESAESAQRRLGYLVMVVNAVCFFTLTVHACMHAARVCTHFHPLPPTHTCTHTHATLTQVVVAKVDADGHRDLGSK